VPKKAKATKKKKEPSVSPTEHLMLFPTFCSVRDWEGDIAKLNEDLRLHIWKQRALNPEGVYRSNSAGTWHSDDFLFRWTGKAGEALHAMFGKHFVNHAEQFAPVKGGKYKLSMRAWAMVYTDRGYATVHNHPNCHLAGVYYVRNPVEDPLTMATGVKVRPGAIEFMDTRGAGMHQVVGLNLAPAARIAPQEGRMLAFPSWLPHFVHPVVGDKERISIACNCTIESYTPPEE
jgi:uncharacterized protein (TIGR02466 family)